ncbi:putative 2-nitropropane dioxygenase [Absidia repens]|uniref:Putative 2-nitropropane dioxygenase n=1 Tax=Absidia repens TaxID=90262 RepID=A0A1X2ICN9_9FUNG|nr:putative 2-nitropropane dioxygenase [Absidia repens]
MPIQTQLTRLLGIRHPIIQGGMQWVGRASLASAVSNAGGLGILTGLTQPTPEDLREEIQKCRQLTDQPFGVNLTFLPSITPPPYKEYAKVVIEEKVPVVETAGNNPGEFIKMFKEANIFTIHKCVAVRHALTAQRLGVDMVSMDGFECAGHPGNDDITNLILLSKTSKTLNIPFVASGGFGNGQGLVAALALGAQGINMGTRFVATKEAPVHDNIKQALVNSDERNTTLIFRPFRNTSRVFKNKVALEVNAIEKAKKEDVVFEDIRELVSGERGRTVFEVGDQDAGVWTAGPVMGLIDDVPTCQMLLDRIVSEAEQIIQDKLLTTIVK